MKSIVPDILILSGSALVSYGSYLIHQPSGFIVAGILALVIGVAAARAGK